MCARTGCPRSVSHHTAEAAWPLQKCGLLLQNRQGFLEPLNLCLTARLTLLVGLRLLHALLVEFGAVVENGPQFRLLSREIGRQLGHGFVKTLCLCSSILGILLLHGLRDLVLLCGFV